MAIPTQFVKEGESISHSFTLNDLDILPVFILDWGLNKPTTNGDAGNSDFKLSYSLGEDSADLKLKALKDLVEEPTETVTIKISGWITYVGEGVGSFHSNIYGDLVYGPKITENISTEIVVKIEDVPSCFDPFELGDLQARRGELRELRSELFPISKEIDTINRGREIIDNVQDQFKFSTKTLDRVSDFLEDSRFLTKDDFEVELAAIRKAGTKLKKEFDQVGEPHDFLALDRKVNNLKFATKDLIQEINERGGELPRYSGPNWKEWGSTASTLKDLFDLGKGSANPLAAFSWVWNLQTENIKGVKINHAINSRLEEYRGEVANAAREVGLKPKKFDSVTEMLEAVEMKIKKQLLKTREEINDLQDCEVESAEYAHLTLSEPDLAEFDTLNDFAFFDFGDTVA